jgi:quercetin dioxygenase-like cupin family protein
LYDNAPYAQPLRVSEQGRILRFTLRPGQTVKQHTAPESPINIVVIAGRGLFTGANELAEQFGPDSLVIFDAGETHSIQAMDENLVFVAFMQGAPVYV